MKRLLVKIGLWLARLGGWMPESPLTFSINEQLGIDGALFESAILMTGQTAKMGGSGEYKRREALRALMNRHPDKSERDLALAIELAIR